MRKFMDPSEEILYFDTGHKFIASNLLLHKFIVFCEKSIVNIRGFHSPICTGLYQVALVGESQWNTKTNICVFLHEMCNCIYHIHEWPPCNFLLGYVFKEIQVIILPSTKRYAYVILGSFSVFGWTTAKLWLIQL